MKDIRIQKVLAEQGLCSRRAAEQLISEGRVKLNGHPVSLGDKMDTAKDLLTVDGQRVFVPRKTDKYYFMLHKPRGYITTASDERGRKTVMELMQDAPVRVYPVGRLDKDSEGLLLFTNDGDFANLLTHPSHGVSKLYRVTVRPHATEEQIISLTDGVTLDDGTKTLPSVLHVITDEPERTVLEMTIREGKNRQIRRMCEAVGLTVIRLRRTALGAVRLGMLQPGENRELTPAEVIALRTAASRGKVTSEIAQNTEANARNHAASKPHGARAPKGGAGAAMRGRSGENSVASTRGDKPIGTSVGRGSAGKPSEGRVATGAAKSGGFGKTSGGYQQGGASKPGSFSKTSGGSGAGSYSKQGSFSKTGDGAKPGGYAKPDGGYQSGGGSKSGSFSKTGGGSGAGSFSKPGSFSKMGGGSGAGKFSKPGSASKTSGGSSAGSFAKPGGASTRKPAAFGARKQGAAGAANNRGGKRGGGRG